MDMDDKELKAAVEEFNRWDWAGGTSDPMGYYVARVNDDGTHHITTSHFRRMTDAEESAREQAIAAVLAPTIDRLTAERDALRVVIEGLNETIDSYWNGDKSDLMVKLITGWQRRCKAVLASSLTDADNNTEGVT